MRSRRPSVRPFGPNVRKILKSCHLDAKQFSDLFSCVRKIRGTVGKIFKGPTTQHLSWDIILFVAENNLISRVVSVSDIYTVGGKSKSTVVSAIKQLEEFKLLEIQSNVQDKRRKSVHVNDLLLSKIIKEFDAYALDVKKIVDRS